MFRTPEQAESENADLSSFFRVPAAGEPSIDDSAGTERSNWLEERSDPP
jgi:hypothetical protein